MSNITIKLTGGEAVPVECLVRRGSKKAMGKCNPETTEQELVDLLYTAGGMQTGPNKRTYATRHYEVCIGIGKDHTATITIDEDSLLALCERNGYTADDLISA